VQGRAAGLDHLNRWLPLVATSPPTKSEMQLHELQSILNDDDAEVVAEGLQRFVAQIRGGNKAKQKAVGEEADPGRTGSGLR
jgi:hypothetical protein